MKSYFISGTDTDVGQTYVMSRLAAAFRKMGIDIGVMKPFAAGTEQKSGFKSEDIQILAKAAQVNDPEQLLNPQFFSIPASPFTASKNLGVRVDVNLILDSFKKLSNMHDMLLVEGMGGIMTPILKDYFVTDLIKAMNLETIIITRSRIGTVNHTIMTCNMCTQYGIKITGIIINNFDSGYSPHELHRDLEEITDVKVLGIIPYIEKITIDKMMRHVEENIDLKLLI